MITAPVLNRATVGAAFSARFSATGGEGPPAWRSLGPLPPGLGLSRDGIVNGTPKAAGSFAFWVVASDGFGRTSVLAVGMRVARPLTAVAQVSPTAVRVAGSPWCWPQLVVVDPIPGASSPERRRAGWH